MGQQLPLDFKFNNEFTFESFVGDSNEELLVALKNISLLDDVPFIYIWGKQGSGKSHLLQALCQSSSFSEKPVAMIPLNANEECEQFAPQMLDGLEAMSLLCFDDVNGIAGKAEWQTALFHLYNRARDNSTPLVVTGDSPPAQLNIDLADLKTRLGWGLIFQLHELNDESKLKALQLRAQHRGMELNAEVGEFLMRRFSRDMSNLIKLIDKLDNASLREHRRLTVPFVKQVLEN